MEIPLGSSGILDTSINIGQYIRFDNKDWIVCHRDWDNNTAYIALSTIDSLTAFGPDGTYSSSTLKTVAKAFEDNMSSAALARMQNVTVNGVTSKIFVASYDQMNGGFSYFSSNDRRICNYNGSAYYYWTSSPYSGSYVWYVYSDGSLSNYCPSDTFGFRPFACISL